VPQEDEVGLYLKSLIDHSEGCLAADCPDCRMLRTIYDLLRRQIFGTAPFPHVTQKSNVSSSKADARSTGS
jgi:hypothetical protein